MHIANESYLQVRQTRLCILRTRNPESLMQEPPALPIGTSEPLGMPRRGAASGIPAHLVGKVLLVVACAVLLYSVVLAFADYRAVAESLTRLPARSIGLSLLLASASFVLRFARWQRYLHWLEIRVPALDSALTFTCGLGMSITPGKAGELLKPLMLHQVTGASMTRTVPILAAERTTDAMALVLLASIGLLPSPWGFAAVALTLAGCFAVACVFAWRGLGSWVIDRASSVRWLGRHRARLLRAHESLLVLCSPSRLLEGFAWSLLAWSVHVCCLYSLAQVFEGVSLSLSHALLIDTLPALAGAFAMLPGGLGLTEASMTGAMVAFGHGAVTPAVAAAITLAVRVTTLWWGVLLGLTALGVWQLRHRSAYRVSESP